MRKRERWVLCATSKQIKTDSSISEKTKLNKNKNKNKEKKMGKRIHKTNAMVAPPLVL